ncbi:MAG: CDP-paratose 2-epimerase [Verrucomicrobia bacterium]|nr:MAG: CDP-paratose 2-epimerase [Verrucomicrobiota bacterium]
MTLPVPTERVFTFFSDVANLPRVEPPWLGFQIISPLPIVMQKGTIIEFKLRLLSLPVRWQSLISQWDPPQMFADEQLRGPFKTWVHIHRFQELTSGTLMEDEVEYSLPFSRLGEMADPLIRRQITRIFRFRQQRIKSILVAS